MKNAIAAISILLCSSLAGAHAAPNPAQSETLSSMKASIEALKSPDVAWRKIAWKSCLLDGIKTSREQKKPMILWVFIDRPVDDQRC